jgi:hypothetical protein
MRTIHGLLNLDPVRDESPVISGNFRVDVNGRTITVAISQDPIRFEKCFLDIFLLTG